MRSNLLAFENWSRRIFRIAAGVKKRPPKLSPSSLNFVPRCSGVLGHASNEASTELSIVPLILEVNSCTVELDASTEIG